MAVIENKELALTEMGRWHPGDLAFITKLICESNKSTCTSDIFIESIFQNKSNTSIGWPSCDQPWFAVSIHFVGIRDLKIQGCGFPLQIMGFDILDISDKQWEDVNFQVEDYENGLLQFCCKNVRITSVNKMRGEFTGIG
ncbi:hypothetical protein ACFL54_04185 [Planctomycetota bacterium]